MSGRTGSTLLQRLLNMSPDTVIFSEQKGLVDMAYPDIARKYFASACRGHADILKKDPKQHFVAVFPSNERIQSAFRAYFETLYQHEDLRWGFVDLFYRRLLRSYGVIFEAFPDADYVFHTREMKPTYDSAVKVGWGAGGYDKWCKQIELNLTLMREFAAGLKRVTWTKYEELLTPDGVKDLYDKLDITFDREAVTACLAHRG